MSYTKEQTNENRKKWIAELRSGKYKQQFDGVLVNENLEFCALAVANLAMGEEVYKVSWLNTPCFIEGDGNPNTSELLKNVAEQLGLPKIPTVYEKEKNRWVNIITLNDFEEYTLEHIADILEYQDEEWDGNVPSEAGVLVKT